VSPVRGDEDRLGQVLVNLLHNAVKFSPNGGEIVVGVREERGQIRMWVRDPGMGVPAADLTRIFERFYKVDRARVRGRGGTGLGLSISRHVVESHGGRIWAESREGFGSTFSFTLPLATEDGEGAPRPMADGSGVEPAGDLVSPNAPAATVPEAERVAEE
jgi:two-component system phosphate regulon sensor histidine kinase PhoR